MSISGSPVIVIADDDEDDLKLAQDAMVRAQINCDIRVVKDGHELMDYLRLTGIYNGGDAVPRPDLILLDLNMPRKDGRQALKEIKSCTSLKSIPVVAFTTSNSKSDINKMYELGANSYLVKPDSYHELVELMKVITMYWFELVEIADTQE